MSSDSSEVESKHIQSDVEAENTSASEPEVEVEENIDTKNPKVKSEGSDAEEELEIDINKPEPLSKKQLRLLKKGKINEDKSGAFKISKKAKKLLDSRDDLDGSEETREQEQKDLEEEQQKKERSKFSAWIGNMTFDTTAEDLKRFIVAKTADLEDLDARVLLKDITRVKMPLSPYQGKKGTKIRGFAYIDLRTQEQLDAVIGLSEQFLNGRNLLIKNATSFEGRPAVVTTTGGVAGTAISKNPPSRILFVGNLAFDTTDEALERHFQHCGDITRVRMATFEDSGNCKGFAFVDFRDTEGATAALKDKSCKKLAGRLLRMEFGEDRSKRTKQDKAKNMGHRERISVGEEFERPVQQREQREQREDTSYESRNKNEKKRRWEGKDNLNKRQKPGLALANAQRAKVSIVPSSGKKTTFD